MKTLNTPIGNVGCELAVNGSDAPVTGVLNTHSHRISCIEFKVKQEWLPPGMHVEDTLGWRWFIERTVDEPESLVITCKLEPETECDWMEDGGDHFDAVSIGSDDQQVHIGAEDPECHYERALAGDWMPVRLATPLSGFQRSNTLLITHYIEYGMKCIIPELLPGEKIYLHFIAAWDHVRPSPNYPGELDVSTWYAVDQQKTFLDKALELAE